jgi:hypothetical protein
LTGCGAERRPQRRPLPLSGHRTNLGGVGPIFWEMTPIDGTLGPANEIDDARWVPLEEARMMLTQEHDRRILGGFHPAR